MSDAGTLLSELDGARPSDGDLVDSILSDLNQSGAPQPPMGVRNAMQNAPPMQSTYPNAADPAVPTAHLIGHDHPTPADFQRMMMNAQGGMQMQQQQPEKAKKYEQPEKNWQGKWVDELKQPTFVAILIFIMTLPAVHVLASHYAPSLLSPGGNFTTMGNVGRAVVAGALYWVLQNVIAPLLSI